MKKKYKEPKLDVIEIRLEDTVLTGSPTEFGGDQPGDNEYNFDSLFN